MSVTVVAKSSCVRGGWSYVYGAGGRWVQNRWLAEKEHDADLFRPVVEWVGRSFLFTVLPFVGFTLARVVY